MVGDSKTHSVHISTTLYFYDKCIGGYGVNKHVFYRSLNTFYKLKVFYLGYLMIYLLGIVAYITTQFECNNKHYLQNVYM